MICPYNRKGSRWVKQTNNNFINEEIGILRSSQEVLVEEFTFLECPKEGCGAWQNEKCNYNQGINY